MLTKWHPWLRARLSARKGNYSHTHTNSQASYIDFHTLAIQLNALHPTLFQYIWIHTNPTPVDQQQLANMPRSLLQKLVTPSRMRLLYSSMPLYTHLEIIVKDISVLTPDNLNLSYATLLPAFLLSAFDAKLAIASMRSLRSLNNNLIAFSISWVVRSIECLIHHAWYTAGTCEINHMNRNVRMLSCLLCLATADIPGLSVYSRLPATNLSRHLFRIYIGDWFSNCILGSTAPQCFHPTE